MEGKGEVGAEDAAGDVLPRGGSASSMSSNDFCEALVEGGSSIMCNSNGFNIRHSDGAHRFVCHNNIAQNSLGLFSSFAPETQKRPVRMNILIIKWSSIVWYEYIL